MSLVSRIVNRIWFLGRPQARIKKLISEFPPMQARPLQPGETVRLYRQSPDGEIYHQEWTVGQDED